MTHAAHYAKALPLAITVGCLQLSTASVADVGPTLAFSDTYSNGVPKEYRTKGDVSGNNGLHLKDQSAVFREVGGHGEIILDFSLEATAITKGDPKFQAQISISDTAVNIQLVQSSAGNRLLLFGYGDGRPPENYREFPIDGPINGRWQVRLSYGLLLVTKEGAPVGQDGISTVDSKFTGVMLASIRGAFSIREFAVNRLLDPPLSQRDAQDLAEADANAGQAQEAALYSQYDKAAAFVQQAIGTYIRVLGPQSVRSAWAEGALGSYLSHTGVTGAARSHIENAMRSFEQTLGPDHPLTATAQLMMANLLIGIDDVDQGYPFAEKALNTALLVYGDRSPVVAAALSTYAAGNLKSHKPREAAESLAAALSIRERVFGKGDLHLTPYMLQLGELYQQLGDYPSAKSVLTDASKILKSTADLDPSNLLRAERSLVGIELSQGHYAEAAAAYDDLALRAAPKFGKQHPNLALILHDGAVAHFAAGDLRTAETNAREALSITEARAREIAQQLSEAEALSFLSSVYPVRDALLSIELAKNPNLTFDQYEELQQARGIYTRTEMVASGAFGLTGPVSSQTTKDLSELADVRSFLAGLASYHGALARDERIPMVLGLITQEKERLQREVATREFKTLKSSNAPADLKTLLADIGDGVAIVDIVASKIWTKGDNGRGQLQHVTRYYAFVVSKSGPGGLSVSTVDLGPRIDADQHVTHWLALLGDRWGEPADEGVEANWIRQHLWNPVAQELRGARSVLIVTDGVFNVMPWAALRSSTNDRFLIEDGYNFITELSVESVGEVSGARDKAVGTGALLVGDLNFGNAVPGETREIYVGTTSDGIWTALQGARAEMLAIEQLAHQAGPVTVLRDDRGTEIAVEQAIPNARFVHFATHGYFAQASQPKQSVVDAGTEFLSALSSRSARSPLLRNGLVLSGANLDPTFEQGTIRINDGLLSAEEIAGLNLSQVELVVLSACETARGVDIAGEGSFGLRRTFLMAGARAVVAGLWRVNDLATKDLMVKFYDLLWHDHLPTAEALRRAQVYMIEKGRSESGQDSARSLPPYAPYYWAAFVASGDWK